MNYLKKAIGAISRLVSQLQMDTTKLDIVDFPPTTNEEHLTLTFVDDIWGDALPVYVVRNVKHPIAMLGSTWEAVGAGKGKVIDGVAYINANQGLKEFGNTYVDLLGGNKTTRRLLHAKMKEAHII